MPKNEPVIDIAKYQKLALKNKSHKTIKGKKPIEESRVGQRIEAARIIATIPFIMELASLKGENSAKVMKVRLENYRDRYEITNEPPKPHWLKGVTATVFRYCTNAGLNPAIEQYHAESSDETCYTSDDIIIHW